LYLSLDDQTLIARRAATEAVEVGQEKAIQFLTDKVFYIDGESGHVWNRN